MILKDRKHIIVIGAPKAGTTWLQHVLDAEPSFWCPPHQEVHFFDKRSSDEISSYEAIYLNAPRDAITVDVTPAYIRDKHALSLISKNIDHMAKDVKLIALLREPVSRAFSHYQMFLNYGRNYKDFLAALSQKDEIYWSSMYGMLLTRL